MEKGIDIKLWIKDFVNDEYNLKFIPNYLKACHRLRSLRNLKEISDAELIKQQLVKYKGYQERRLEKKGNKKEISKKEGDDRGRSM